MFKNIQKQLLLKYPLLWNTKFIPMLIVGVFINLIYFLIGYADGTIDFTKRYDSNIDFTFFAFLGLISIIILIIWLVGYFKNNSFKRFYTKSKNALFFEWIQIVIIVLLLSMFYFPFEYGRELHKRSYFSEEVAKKRCETISSADIFIDGSFEEAELDSINSVLKDTTINGEYKPIERVYLDYVRILGEKYSPEALINRNVAEFGFFTRAEDSIRELKIRKFLATNNTFEVKKIMRDYFGILKEHKLKTNLTEDKWFNVIYDYPEFKKFVLINPRAPQINYNNSGYTEAYTYNEYPGQSKSYSDYYIEQDVLKDNYHQISRAYTNSVFEIEGVLVLLYVVLGFSLLIFSFRVTSGKNWLIALVSYGIFNIVIGIISALSREFTTYPILLIISLLIVCGIFFSVVVANKTKSKTMVFLNLILWLFGGLIPVAYFTYLEKYRESIYSLENYDSTSDPHLNFLNENIPTMFIINIVLIFIGMFFMSRIIRNWKGIAEE